MKKKVYIKTWGCQMNQYDSSKIEDLLKFTKYYSPTLLPEKADVLILNTCSIREKAQEKLFHQLGRWNKLKKNNPNLIICVGGCVASQEGNAIFKRAKNVDIIFGPHTLHRLPKMIHDFKKFKKPILDLRFLENEKFDYFPESSSKNSVAFVSIMEGCSKYCTFCIVPFTRGEEFSRPCDDILFEISQLSKQGIREINLLGQNVNAYNGKKFDNKICSFPELLRMISVIDGIDRIRFITSHPIDFTDDLIKIYKDIPKIVNFLHLPVQSGSDRILNLMKRAYSIKEYKNIINKLLSIRPKMQISSDFIIGFPGETKKDFEKTMTLIKEINFDMSFSFIYSSRPGTVAAKINDSTSLEEKKRRLYLLQNLINHQTTLWSKKMVGTVQQVLVEGISKKNIMKLSGKTENNRVVDFTGSPDMIGKFVNVKITNAHSYSLSGILDDFNIF